MRAAALQFDVRPDDPQHNLAAVEAGLRRAAREGVRVVSLPEMWPTSFADVTERREELLELTRCAWDAVAGWSRELDLCVGGSGFGDSADPARLVNRYRLFDRGECVLEYDKVHLFTPTAEGKNFVAGDEAPGVVETSVGRVACAVCYDLRFPETTRPSFSQGVQVLLVAAQWPAPRAAHWRALAVARAIENQCFVVATNRTGSEVLGRRRRRLEFPGNSLIVSPHGEVLAEGHGVDGLVAAHLDLEEARHYRVRVPVAKDRRPDLYARWTAEEAAR